MTLVMKIITKAPSLLLISGGLGGGEMQSWPVMRLCLLHKEDKWIILALLLNQSAEREMERFGGALHSSLRCVLLKNFSQMRPVGLKKKTTFQTIAVTLLVYYRNRGRIRKITKRWRKEKIDR